MTIGCGPLASRLHSAAHESLRVSIHKKDAAALKTAAEEYTVSILHQVNELLF